MFFSPTIGSPDHLTNLCALYYHMYLIPNPKKHLRLGSQIQIYWQSVLASQSHEDLNYGKLALALLLLTTEDKVQ